MLNKSNTHYPYEHYGDLAVDFGSTYWETLTAKHINTKEWRPVGFKFSISNTGKFSFYIWATPIPSTSKDKEKVPIKKFKTEITLEDFSKSFVRLNAQAFWGRKEVDCFYEMEDES